jgi:hypothetical protein
MSQLPSSTQTMRDAMRIYEQPFTERPRFEH